MNYVRSVVILSLMIAAGCTPPPPEDPVGLAPGYIQSSILTDATVGVWNLNDRSIPSVLCSTQSVGDTITLPDNCIERGQRYWIKVNQCCNPEFQYSTVISGDDLYDLDSWTVSAISDTLYQSIHHSLDQSSIVDIDANLDRIASLLLTSDLNGDGNINAIDVATWRTGDPSAIDELVASTEYLFHRTENASNPVLDNVLIGRLDTLYPANKVRVHDNFGYVATDVALLIVDITDNTQPTLVAAHATGWIQDMALNGDSIYLALGSQGVEQVDISNPAQPVLASFIDQPADRIDSFYNRMLMGAKVGDDLVLGSLTHDTATNTHGGLDVTASFYLPNDELTSFRFAFYELFIFTQSATDSQMLRIDPITLGLLGSYSFSQDFQQPAGTKVVDSWADSGTTPGGADFVISTRTRNHVGGDAFRLIALGSSNDFAYIGGNAGLTVFWYNQVGKSFVMSPSIMYCYDFDDLSVELFSVDMPVDVRIIYEPRDSQTFENADHKKRFKVTTDTQYSYWASDKYGFSVLKHF